MLCSISEDYSVEKGHIKSIGTTSERFLHCQISTPSANPKVVTVVSRDVVMIVGYIGYIVSSDIVSHCKNVAANWRKCRNFPTINTCVQGQIRRL